MQKLKRPVSIILSILMVVSMFVAVPVTASAATDVAQIGGTGYETLEAAFAAAQDGDTITVLADSTGNGIKVTPAGKFATGLTVDFGGHTYTVDGETVGSTGTETNGFQLLKNNKVTFKNGTITSAKAKILVQNYSNLTLEGMTLTLDNPNYAYAYTLSNNNGNVVIDDTTINANPAGGFAFDVCRYSSYPSVNVTVKGDSVINGNVEVSASKGDAKDGFSLKLEGGEMYGTVVVDESAQTAMDTAEQGKVTLTTNPDFKFYVAKIGDNKYETLEAAFAAAADGNTITLLADCAGNGIKVTPAGKFANGLTVDFAGHTYTVDGETVGSTGTETNGFQLLKNNKVTFKNGTITSAKAKILVQNYSNLTLDNMTLTLKNPNYAYAYTLSNNNGDVVIDNTTINANPAGGFAFDVCRYASYPSVNVTVKGNSVINGNVEIDATGGDAKDGFSLTLESGTLNGAIAPTANAKTAMAKTPDKAQVDKATTFNSDAPAGYMWVADGEGTQTLAKVVAKIGETKYEDLQTALNAAQAGDEIVVLDNIALTGANWFVVNKDVTIDLNGKTISSEDSVFVTKNGADLTVKKGTMTSSVANDYAIYVNDGSVFTLEDDATLTATNANGNGIIVRTGGQADINGTIETGYYSIAGFGTSVVNVNDGASITSTDASALSGNGSDGNEGYTFNVKGGTLTSTNDVAIYHPNQGTLNITGGTITGKTAVYVKSGSTSISGSSTSISGATISGTGEATAMVHSGNGCNATGDAIVIENCGYPGGTPAIAISGGTITSVNAQPVASYGYNDGTNDYKAITEFISGGTYNKAVPAELCAPAYAPVENGDSTYGVAKAYVAKIGTTKYKTFAQAVAARANNDDVITLLDKVTDAYTGENTDFPIKVAKDGKSVTVKVNGAYIVSSSTADGVTTYTITEAAIEFTSTSGAVSYKSNIDYSNMGSSGTYKLLKDITANSRIAPGIFASNVTIDLNGHTLTSNATDQAFLFSRGGSKTFVITDTSTNGGGKIVANNLANTGTSNTASVISISGNNNNVTISNITIETTQGIGLIGTNQSLTIDNCDITVNGTDYALATNGSQTNGAAITVTDSSIESTNGIAVYLPGGATSTFTDTDVTGTTAMYIKSGTTTIDGGTYTATGDAAEFTHNGNGANATGDAIVVESCNYPNGVPTVSIGADDVVSAHGKQIGDYTYGENVPFGDVTATSNTLTLPEDLKWVETETEGVYEVAPKVYVAQVGDNKYETVNDAVAAAGENGEVKLIADINGNVGIGGVNTPYNTTLDLNGHTITNTSGSGITLYSQFTAPATFTIKDTSANQTGRITINKKYPGDGCISDSSGRHVIIEGGTYESDDKALYISSDEGWTINGGTFNGKIHVISDVAITGGTFHGEVVQSSKPDYSTPYPWTEIPAEIAISGGTFDAPVPEDFCADGYTPKNNGNGTYGVTKKLFVGHNLILGGDIGVNFFLNPEVLNTYSGTKTVKFTCDGEVTTVAVPENPETDGYKVTCNVVAARMAHKIKAVVYVNGTALDQTDSYSVQDYAEAVYKDKNKSEKLRALAKAMLNYGAQAQNVFADALNDTTPAPANTTVGNNGYADVTAKQIGDAVKGTSADLNKVAEKLGAEFYTSSLIYLSENTLRLYFTPASKTVGALDGKGFSNSLSGYYYYVDHENIPAAELDEQKELTVGDYTFTYTALDYAKAVVNSGMGYDQKNLAKALFLYNQAANDYFDD